MGVWGHATWKCLQNRCSEIAFYANFDLLADKLNIYKKGLTTFFESALALLLPITKLTS